MGVRARLRRTRARACTVRYSAGVCAGCIICVGRLRKRTGGRRHALVLALAINHVHVHVRYTVYERRPAWGVGSRRMNAGCKQVHQDRRRGTRERMHGRSSKCVCVVRYSSGMHRARVRPTGAVTANRHGGRSEGDTKIRS